MFAPFQHNATFYDETTGPQPDYLRAYGPRIQPFQAEDATRILRLEYNLEQHTRSNYDYAENFAHHETRQMVPSYQTGPPLTGPPFTMPRASEPFRVLLNDNDNGYGLSHPSPFTPFTHPSRTTATASFAAPAPTDMMSSEFLSDLHDWSDERMSDLVARMLPMQRAREDDETGDRAAAERGETQELPVRRTPASKQEISKPGHRALGMENLVVPLQGVSLTRSPGPVVTGATPGPLERDEDRAEGRGGIIEDRHDEDETDEQRRGRLMKREDDVWKCVGCNRREFSDRSTLQRHCKSLAHGKKRDIRKCPQCDKKYARRSGVKRHMMKNHSDGAT